MRFQLPPQIFQQSQMAPPASVEPPMPQYPSNNPAIFQALQEKHAKLTSAAQKAQEKAQKLLEEAGQLKAPEQAQPMGYRDILPVGGLMLLAKLLGAKDRDLGEGLAGFAQGRQGWAQGENQTRVRNFEQQREALLNQGNMAQGQYSDLLKQALGAESQMFDVQKDERDFEQQRMIDDARAKSATELESLKAKGRMDLATVRADSAFMTKLLGLPSKQARYIAAREKGLSEADADMLAEMTEAEKNLAARTETENATRPGKVDALALKNDYQRIINEFLPEEKRTGINLKEAQIRNYNSLIEWRPAYVNIALKKLDLAMMLGQNTIGNTQFDNELQGWKAEVDPKVTALQEEMKGHISRQKELVKNIQKLQEAGEDTGTLGEELSRVNARVKQISDRLQQIGDTAPIYRPSGPPGVVQPPPTGSVNLPPVQGSPGIDKSGGASALTPAEIAANKKAKGMAPVNAGALPVTERKPAQAASTTQKATPKAATSSKGKPIKTVPGFTPKKGK